MPDALNGSSDAASRPVPAELVRQLRRRLGLKQRALSGLLGLGPHAVQRFEQDGAPEWFRLALVGVAVLECGEDAAEFTRLAGVDPGAVEARARRGDGQNDDASPQGHAAPAAGPTEAIGRMAEMHADLADPMGSADTGGEGWDRTWDEVFATAVEGALAAHRAAGIAVYYSEPAREGAVIRENADGRRFLVDDSGYPDVRVLRELVER